MNAPSCHVSRQGTEPLESASDAPTAPPPGGMGFVIEGLGTALPQGRLEQAQTARALARISGSDPAKYAALFRRANIQARHFALPPDVLSDLVEGTTHTDSPFVPRPGSDQDGPSTGQRMKAYSQLAPELALRAARIALEEAGVAPETVAHLITVSCTGFAAPGVDLALIEGLNLPRQVQRLHVGFMGCHGAVNALRTARGLAAVEEDPQARLLTVAVELCSIHFRSRPDPRSVVANALFADGAAAVVGRGERHATAASLPTGSGYRVVDGGAMLFPGTAEAMTWTIGDHGYEMTLDPRVPEWIGAHLRPWLEPWLARRGLGLESIGSWAVHPGGPRVLDATAEALGLPSEALAVSRQTLAELGNLSSPTILFLLERLRRRSAPRPVLALGFGPGLAAEVLLLE